MKVLSVITITATLVIGAIDKTIAEDLVRVKIPSTNQVFVIGNPNRIPVRNTLNNLGAVNNRINRVVPNILPKDKRCYFLGLGKTSPTRRMFAKCATVKSDNR
jgi:hypothetical protein